jgi:hypothetical protein
VAGHERKSLDPNQFEYSKYRWIVHGVEPWLHNGLWRFSGTFPLLALVDGKGVDANLVGLRFIARSETLLDITYDSSIASLIEPAIDAGLEAITEDVLRVKTIDPAHFIQRQTKKPDAGSFLSTLQAAFPENSSPAPALELPPADPGSDDTILGPARFLKRHNEITEFEMRWLFSEWLLESGLRQEKNQAPESLMVRQARVSLKLQEFARELVEDLHPDLDLEVWQECDSGHDHLQRVDPVLAGGPWSPNGTDLSFDALIGVPGVVGFSHRAQRGSSERTRPLGAALILRFRSQTSGQPVPAKPQLDSRLIPILQRITAFLSQSLPPVSEAQRSGVSLSDKKVA